MGYIALWLGSSLMCFGMEVANEFRIFKDIANQGYKISVERMRELGTSLDNSNNAKLMLFLMFVPIANFIKVLSNTNKYNNNRQELLNQFYISGLLEEMTEEEIEKFKSKPTTLNAITISYKTVFKQKIELAKSMSVKITKGNEVGKIFYEFGDSIEDIKILQATGYASNLTLEEQKELAKMSWDQVFRGMVEKGTDDITLARLLKTNTVIDLDKLESSIQEEKTLTPRQLEIKRDKEALEKMKNLLIVFKSQNKEKQKLERLNREILELEEEIKYLESHDEENNDNYSLKK